MMPSLKEFNPCHWAPKSPISHFFCPQGYIFRTIKAQKRLSLLQLWRHEGRGEAAASAKPVVDGQPFVASLLPLGQRLYGSREQRTSGAARHVRSPRPEQIRPTFQRARSKMEKWIQVRDEGTMCQRMGSMRHCQCAIRNWLSDSLLVVFCKRPREGEILFFLKESRARQTKREFLNVA